MIGVFDSGIGGLTVLSHIHALMPTTPICYVADSHYAPYGDLDEAVLIRRVRQISNWLMDQGASVIVVACNTATAIAIDQLRDEIEIPIVGVEPGVKPAALNSSSQTIGILATENTVASRRYSSLIERFVPNVRVISAGCSGLADAIERSREKAKPLVAKYVTPMLEQGVDHIVLGCTHYPLVKEEITALVKNSVVIVDTGNAVAQEVARRYESIRLAIEGAPSKTDAANLQIFTTGSIEQVEQVTKQYEALAFLNGVKVSALSL